MSQADANAAQSNAETMLARTVVDLGLATSDEVADCQAFQEQLAGEAENQRSLADLLVSKIIKKLGTGAMATVLKARQVSLDRIVAVKVLPKKHMTDPQFVERFYAEGRAAAKLNHANIVQAIDVGQAGDYHYFVMEYVEGTTVYEHLVNVGRYAEDEALRIVMQIAQALHHAHEKGFMHRDVKPKNIMITSEGVAKLADMGLARQVTDRQAAEAEAGKAYGTPYYISPEQIRGEVDVDFRADIYGLGATFYHMLTGQVPFEAPNPSAVMHRHLKSELTPPDHLVPELSRGAAEIVEVMMAKKRDERYASTADLLEDLKSVAAGEPPMQARRKFELTDLAGLERTGDQLPADRDAASPALTEQPVFWVAVFSIVLNVILAVLAIIGFAA
jgi:serine/threonine-protein kinase